MFYETATKQERNGNETATKQEELNIINANNANKITAAAITGEDVPTTSPKAEGEDVPTTSSKADAAVEEVISVMTELYFKYTGKMANAMDFVCMQEIADITTDKELISGTMRLTNEKFVPKFSGDKIKSFKYFTFALKEAVERERVRKNAAYTGSNKTVADGKSVKDSEGFEGITEETFNDRLNGL